MTYLLNNKRGGTKKSAQPGPVRQGKKLDLAKEVSIMQRETDGTFFINSPFFGEHSAADPSFQEG